MDSSVSTTTGVGEDPVDDLRQAQEIKAQGERLLEESRTLQENSKTLLEQIEPT